MKPFTKAGILLISAFLLSSEAPRNTSGDFLMQSYSEELRKQLVPASPAEYRAGQYRARYEVCGPNHDCRNVTAGEAARKGMINAQDAAEAKRKFPFMSIPAFQ